MVAESPTDIRRAWVHRAPEKQVIALFRAVRDANPELEAPWWLRAVADGALPSRAAAFALEDEVAALLADHPGWIFVAWTAGCIDGYWEYLPSETGPEGPRMPTTLQFTARHAGWLDVIPAHTGPAPAPTPVAGIDGLRTDLPQIER